MIKSYWHWWSFPFVYLWGWLTYPCSDEDEDEILPEDPLTEEDKKKIDDEWWDAIA